MEPTANSADKNGFYVLGGKLVKLAIAVFAAMLFTVIFAVVFNFAPWVSNTTHAQISAKTQRISYIVSLPEMATVDVTGYRVANYLPTMDDGAPVRHEGLPDGTPEGLCVNGLVRPDAGTRMVLSHHIGRVQILIESASTDDLGMPNGDIGVLTIRAYSAPSGELVDNRNQQPIQIRDAITFKHDPTCASTTEADDAQVFSILGKGEIGDHTANRSGRIAPGIISAEIRLFGRSVALLSREPSLYEVFDKPFKAPPDVIIRPVSPSDEDDKAQAHQGELATMQGLARVAPDGFDVEIVTSAPVIQIVSQISPNAATTVDSLRIAPMSRIVRDPDLQLIFAIFLFALTVALSVFSFEGGPLRFRRWRRPAPAPLASASEETSETFASDARRAAPSDPPGDVSETTPGATPGVADNQTPVEPKAPAQK